MSTNSEMTRHELTAAVRDYKRQRDALQLQLDLAQPSIALVAALRNHLLRGPSGGLELPDLLAAALGVKGTRVSVSFGNNEVTFRLDQMDWSAWRTSLSADEEAAFARIIGLTAPDPDSTVHPHGRARCRYCGRTGDIAWTNPAGQVTVYAPHNVPDEGGRCFRSAGQSVDPGDIRP